ncbi:BTAD domain-containing putative transcriptional regulator [Spirillospora sp. NPDC047279]|uniref:AfsR/SARP family transcriptional regulator n=1 Tax=Spirillospora sp. NPDC047279 TaxID=3155478 RepID=UPI003402C486
MRFGVLGPLAVWTDDGRPVRIPELKVRALLADLLVHQGRPVPVDRLVADLWGERLPRNPINTLQTRVSQLRRALEEAEPGGRELVVSQSPGYLLRVDPQAVDTGRFHDLAARARTTDDLADTAAALAAALALWRGPAYADFGDEEFVRPAIGRLEEERLAVLEEHAEVRLELGEHRLLVGELGDLVTRYPLRERLRAVHLRALYRAGRQSEALAGYAEVRTRLADELGLDPSPELAALHEAMLRQDAALEPPRPRPARTNLPAALTALVGRDGDLTEVTRLLDKSRLVTLTGPGGVGKTRLAVEAARNVREAFPDGVWLVELAGLEPASGATPGEVVAAALGVRDDETGDLNGQLQRALKCRILLVLDNCEHVVGPVAELAGSLLRGSPGLHVLATGQEPLGVEGETTRSVPPLDEDAAVRLFAERAAAGAPFELTPANADAVAALYVRATVGRARGELDQARAAVRDALGDGYAVEFERGVTSGARSWAGR